MRAIKTPNLLQRHWWTLLIPAGIKYCVETPGISITALALFAIAITVGGIVWAVNQ